MNEKLPTLGKWDFIAKYLTWGFIILFFIWGVYVGIENMQKFYRTDDFRFVLVTVVNIMGMTIAFGILWYQRKRNKRIKAFLEPKNEMTPKNLYTEEMLDSFLTGEEDP